MGAFEKGMEMFIAQKKEKLKEKAKKQLYSECSECLKVLPTGSRWSAQIVKLIHLFVDNAVPAFPELDEDCFKDIKWRLNQKFSR